MYNYKLKHLFEALVNTGYQQALTYSTMMNIFVNIHVPYDGLVLV